MRLSPSPCDARDHDAVTTHPPTFPPLPPPLTYRRYASVGQSYSQPNQTAPYAALGTSGTELVIIKPNALLGQGCNVGVACVVSIGVFGSVGGSYTIVGGGASNSTSLSSGMPVQGYVAQGGSANYVFNVLYRSNVSIIVTSLSGNPQLYVSAVNPFPTASNFNWSSTTPNVDQRVWLPTNDPSYPSGANFPLYIGVAGYNTNATFMITATMMNSASSSAAAVAANEGGGGRRGGEMWCTIQSDTVCANPPGLARLSTPSAPFNLCREQPCAVRESPPTSLFIPVLAPAPCPLTCSQRHAHHAAERAAAGRPRATARL